MAIGRVGKSLVSPLLVVNSVANLIILGLAGWSLDKYIDGEQNHPHLGGNTSTSFMLMFGLICGVIGVCSVITGLLHLRSWTTDSLAAAISQAIISCSITALAFGLVCKEIILGGRRGKRLVRIWNLISHVLPQTFSNTGSIHYNITAKPVAVSGTTACWCF
ncbi:hypothetical protein Pint_18803 [Pistacia integerrima]|uniref:Uncharacterized protein n=1 Tax=Pistacia integerrima TaxID=434235 RepID=A0ACC0YYH0_9ROSI|nr:hypothetical protein Pint_18803 [Pistacia integerrima]